MLCYVAITSFSKMQLPAGKEITVVLEDAAGRTVVAAGGLDAVEAYLREQWHLGPLVAAGGGGAGGGCSLG